MAKSNRVLYYNLYLDSDNKIFNTIQTTIVSNVTGSGLDCLPKNPYFCGSGIRLMCDRNGVQNNDIFSVSETETPEDTLLGLPALMNETMTIQTTKGLISFQAIYANMNIGNGVTTIPYVEYAVLATSGEFTGATSVAIYFDNKIYRRTIVIGFE